MCWTDPELLNLNPVDLWGMVIHCCGDFPEHCKIFSDIPYLYPLHIRTIIQWFETTQTTLDIVKCPLGSQVASGGEPMDSSLVTDVGRMILLGAWAAGGFSGKVP